MQSCVSQVVVELPDELSAGFLAQLRARGRQPAPKHLLQTALLLPDYTLLPTYAGRTVPQLATIVLPRCTPHGRQDVSAIIGERTVTLGIELKPKCGFLPSAATIQSGNSVKKQRSRFTLHQQLKLAQVPHFPLFECTLTTVSFCERKLRSYLGSESDNLYI